ncbi:MAG: hypothetical protein ACFFFC_05945 [Candidatus Thorarchaeota archaeon]
MAIHPVFVHFHTGILTTTVALSIVNMFLRIAYRDSIQTPGTRLARLFHEFDAYIYWGNIIGLLGLGAGAVTGFMDWPMEALVLNKYMRYKILWSTVAMEVFAFLVLLRAKLGDRVWLIRSSFISYGFLTIWGGLLVVLIGAMGGIAVYGTSILSPFLDWLGMPWP